MSLKAILWDLDGVLVNAAEWHYEALNRALMKVIKRPIPHWEHIERFNGLTTRGKLDILLEEGRITKGQIEVIYHIKQVQTQNIILGKCKPTDRVNILQELNYCYTFGCVTNCIRSTTKLMLTHSNLKRFFEVIITNQDVTRPKPRADPYIIAMYKLKVKPHETLIVEDNSNGILSARGSGAHVHVLEDFNDLSKLKGVIRERFDSHGR